MSAAAQQFASRLLLLHRVQVGQMIGYWSRDAPAMVTQPASLSMSRLKGMFH